MNGPLFVLASRGLGWAIVPQHIALYPLFRDRLVTTDTGLPFWLTEGNNGMKEG